MLTYTCNWPRGCVRVHVGWVDTTNNRITTNMPVCKGHPFTTNVINSITIGKVPTLTMEAGQQVPVSAVPSFVTACSHWWFTALTPCMMEVKSHPTLFPRLRFLSSSNNNFKPNQIKTWVIFFKTWRKVHHVLNEITSRPHWNSNP